MKFFCALFFIAPVFAQEQTTPIVTVPVNVAPPPASTVDPNKVVLQVGDIKITAQQLDNLIDVYPMNQQLYFRGAGKQQFADTVVRMLVLAEEGRKRKLDETEKFKDQRRFSEANILAGAVNAQFNDEYKPDEAALRKFYDDHHCEYQTWKVRQIVVRGPGSPMPLKAGEKERTDEEALARAVDLRKRLETGADFAELARSESDDASSGAKGGEFGPVKHAQVVPQLEDAMCKMYVSQLSDPIKTVFGYHLIQMQTKEVRPFDEVKVEIQERSRPEAVKKRIDELISQTTVVKDPEYYAPDKPAEPSNTEPNFTPIKK